MTHSRTPDAAAPEKSVSDPTPDELVEIAVAVVGPAAELAWRMREEGIASVSTKSTDTDVVTAADKAVERQVGHMIRRLRPGDTILGEEFGDGGQAGGPDTTRGSVRWILDPIDGTVNYLYGVPQYAVSLAAEVNGVVVAGVVRNIATGQQWTASAGGGAHADGKPIHGSSQTRLGHALVATGFGYDAARRAAQARALAGVLPRVRDIRRLGAAAIDLCLAAEGTVDAYYEKGLNPWDYAAGALIAREAGLRVTGLGGEPAGSHFLMAAPPALYGPLRDLLEEVEADAGP